MSKAKYVRGDPITSFVSLLNADFIYFCHKVIIADGSNRGSYDG